MSQPRRSKNKSVERHAKECLQKGKQSLIVRWKGARQIQTNDRNKRTQAMMNPDCLTRTFHGIKFDGYKMNFDVIKWILKFRCYKMKRLRKKINGYCLLFSQNTKAWQSRSTWEGEGQLSGWSLIREEKYHLEKKKCYFLGWHDWRSVPPMVENAILKYFIK